MVKTLLSHPLTRGLDIDDPQTTHLRRQIIQKKGFLRQIYQEWYRAIARDIPDGEQPVLELGSGAGFLSEFIPGLITSEVFACPDIHVVLDGQQLPFRDEALRGIVMTNVLHHVPEPRRFLREAAQCIHRGGVVVMLEPWVSPWSRLVYTRLHHEPLLPDVPTWEIDQQGGPLSAANMALPWIIFQRDRALFEQQFPMWHIQRIEPGMPFRYLVSGGVSLRSLVPSWSFGAWEGLERVLLPWMEWWAMFAKIVLVKKHLP